MRKVIAFFIEHSRVTNLITILVFIAGIYSLLQLQRQKYPPFAFNVFMISTVYPGASPEDVEINVTDPLEEELVEVEDIEEIRSVSMENFSMIMVAVDSDAENLGEVKSNVQAALDRVSSLPAQVTERPMLEEIKSTNAPILEIALTGDVPEKTLREQAQALEIALKGSKGIGRIEKIGYRKREVHVEADHAKLDQMHIALGELMTAIQARNVRSTGGTLQSYVSETNVVTFSEYDEPMDVRDVIIRSTFTGEAVRVSDVATVKEDFEDADTLIRADGKPAVSLVIRAQEHADIIDLSEDVRERLAHFQKALPEGVNAKITFDASKHTESVLEIVRGDAISSFFLLLFTMALFVDFRTSFWTAFGLMFTVTASFIFFEPIGLSLNLLCLSAMIIVFGILVDDAIVVSDNICQYKEKGMDSKTASIEGTYNLFWEIIGTFFTMTLAFLPMLSMGGITGKVVKPIPQVVILIMLISVIEAMLFLPSHVAHAKPLGPNAFQNRWFRPVARLYGRFIGWVVAHNKLVIILLILGACSVIFISRHVLKLVLFPVEDPDSFHVIIEAPQGTSLDKTAAMISDIEKIVDESVPERLRLSYTSQVGHHDTDVAGASLGRYNNWGLVSVYLKPAEERDIVSEVLAARVEEKARKLEGFDRLNVVPHADNPPLGKPVTVTYTSSDDALRSRFAAETIELLKKIDGTHSIESTELPGKDELRLMLDQPTMARLGITSIDVARTVRTAFEGEVVTSIRREGEEIDFRVKLQNPEAYRSEGIMKLLIANRTGSLVELGKFSYFGKATGLGAIHHHGGDRSVTITAEVDTKKITSSEANRLVRETFEPKVLAAEGIKLELGGEEKKTAESLRSFFGAALFSIVAIYFVLVLLYNSYLQPLLIMSTIPFSVVGSIIGLMLNGMPLGFIGMIGVLGLSGVVVNDTIIMVTRLNEVCAEKGKTFSSIVEAATSRFRAVVLVSLTTVVGLFPTAYGIGGKLHIMRPMVMVLLWGIALATMITLVALPALYALVHRVKAEE